MPEEFVLDIVERATTVRDSLENYDCLPIEYDLNPIPPYCGDGAIKLIIVGQDPTVKNKKSREQISVALNLDKKCTIATYIEEGICKPLGISLDEVYATNLFKYFYQIPPSRSIDVLNAHLKPNLELLLEEIRQLPVCPVITLGEPVLQLLSCDSKVKLRNYWNYNGKGFSYLQKEENKLGRIIFPFVHLNSRYKSFYKAKFSEFSAFVHGVIDTMQD